MKYRHLSAHEEQFVLGINHTCHRPNNNNNHHNSKPLLMSRYTVVTHILFLKSTECQLILDHPYTD